MTKTEFLIEYHYADSLESGFDIKAVFLYLQIVCMQLFQVACCDKNSAHALPDWIQSNIYSDCILLLRQRSCRRDRVRIVYDITVVCAVHLGIVPTNEYR